MTSGLKWAFVSGIEANDTGTGRFMQHLQAAILRDKRYDGTIVYCPKDKTLTPDMLNWLSDIPHIVIFHPQMLGVRETIQLMQLRAAAGRTTHLYMLDNFFFCVRSYNHLDQEHAPCMRCVGPEQGMNAIAQNCRPWPAADALSPLFIAELHRLVEAGHVHLFAQNEKQIELARRHFGPQAQITYAGLWCADWTEFVDRFMTSGAAEGDSTTEASPFDVVYHGSRDPAKGLLWVLDLAAQCPELRVLIPLDRGALNFSGPPNASIQPMKWESGLHQAVRAAKLVLAPSLWSSPCEGALIKNIVVAKAAAVVDVPSAFSSEIPTDVVMRLPANTAEAAQAVRQALASQWRPNAAHRKSWVQHFRATNEDVANRLIPAKG